MSTSLFKIEDLVYIYYNASCKFGMSPSPGEIKSREVELDSQESSGEIKNGDRGGAGLSRELKNREVELDSHAIYSWAVLGSGSVHCRDHFCNGAGRAQGKYKYFT